MTNHCNCRKCRVNNRVKTRLFFLRQKPETGVISDGFRKAHIEAEWVETDELSLGSVLHPNTDVIQFSFQPMKEEKDKSKGPLTIDDLFRKFTDGNS